MIRLRAVWVHFAASLLLGCARGPGSLELEPLCASACTALTAGCEEAQGLARDRRSSCERDCHSASERARAVGCEERRRAYLACVQGLAKGCAPVTLSVGSVLENATGLSGCEREHAEYFRCTAVCRDAGSVWTRSTQVPREGRVHGVHAELVLGGCSAQAPRSPPKQSDAGALCTHHSVCTKTLCSCPGKRAHYFARACVDGACAEGRLACELVPQAVAHEACP